MEKSNNPFLKFKTQLSIVWVVVQGILVALIQFGKLDPAMVETIKQLMVYATVIAGVVLTGHTVTDVSAIVTGAKDKAAADVATGASVVENVVAMAKEVKTPQDALALATKISEQYKAK